MYCILHGGLDRPKLAHHGQHAQRPNLTSCNKAAYSARPGRHGAVTFGTDLALYQGTMRWNKWIPPDSRGFTLIELLIVTVILGLIAAIAIPKYTNTKQQAYIAGMKSDLRNLAAAEETYFVDNLAYTTSISLLTFSKSQNVGIDIVEGNVTGWRATATHKSAAVICELYYGNAAGPSTATSEGVVACL